MNTRGDVTALISLWRSGNKEAEARLFEVVYRDLHSSARSALRGSYRELSLGATGLVNEAYIRLQKQGQIDVADRNNFLRFAAHVMRQIVIDRARARCAEKRGGGLIPVSYEENSGPSNSGSPLESLQIDQALRTLKAISPRQEEIVEMRYFAGYSIEETALLLGLSSRTVKRDFETARARLRLAIDGDRRARTAGA